MRKLVLVIGGIVIVAAALTWVRAQGRRISPHESTSGTIDSAEITITYGRPSVRGQVRGARSRRDHTRPVGHAAGNGGWNPPQGVIP